MRINHTLFFLSISIFLLTRFIFLFDKSCLLVFIVIFIYYICSNRNRYIFLDLLILIILLFFSFISYKFINITLSNLFMKKAFNFFIKKDQDFYNFFIFNKYVNSSFVKKIQDISLYHVFIVSGFHLNFLQVVIFKNKTLKAKIINLVFYFYLGLFLFSSMSYWRVMVGFIINIFIKKNFKSQLLSFILVYILFFNRNLHSYSLVMSFISYLLVYYLNKIIKNKIVLFFSVSFLIQSIYCLCFSFISSFGFLSFIYSIFISYYVLFFYLFSVLFFYLPYCNYFIYFLHDNLLSIIQLVYKYNFILYFSYNINIIEYVFFPLLYFNHSYSNKKIFQK